MSGRPTAEMLDRLRSGKGLSTQEHAEIADRLAEQEAARKTLNGDNWPPELHRMYHEDPHFHAAVILLRRVRSQATP